MLILLAISMLTLAFNIQQVNASGTTYIRADGSVEGTTDISSADNITYTFTDNIYDSIVVERDNIVVDGAGYTVQGEGSETGGAFELYIGIKLSYGNNVTVKNVEVTDFAFGIFLVYSSNNTLTGNTASNNAHDGIRLERSSNNTLAGNTVSYNERSGIHLDSSSNNVLAGNNASNNGDGIYLWDSRDNVFAGNTASFNNRYGIWVRSGNNVLSSNTASNNEYGIYLSSSNNNLSGNTASNNEYDFGVEGYSLSGFINYVDTSNTVDGKPIYYLIDKANAVIDAQTNAGTIYAINCNNMTIRDLTLTKNEYGVLFWDTANSKIENVTTSNNGYGIYLRGSSNNVFFHNNFVNNTKYGSVQQVSGYGSINAWDDGYPSGGNFWSDYTGVDMKSGSYQNETGSDGIGDMPYTIDADNQDNYPLMSPWGDVEPPVADAGSNQSVFQGMTVTFDASGSTDDVAIKSYVWTFTDVAPKTLTGIKPEYTFNNIGNFEVTLNVTDYADKWNTDTLWVHVSGDTIPPVANAGPDQTVDEDTLVTLDGSGSTDNGNITSYTWTFIDVTPQTLTGVDPTYTFQMSREYTITLNVTDTAGNWDTDTVQITVLDVTNPSIGVISQEPDIPYEGEKVTIMVDVTDEGSGVHNVTLLYSINEGATWTDVPMSKTTEDAYLGEIPGLPSGTNVRYKIIAYDNAGNLAVEDKAGQYYVYVAVQVGVKADDWIKCDYTVTGWPSATPRPEWLKVEILSVEGTAASVRVTMHMSDGTEQSDTVNVDVATGSGTFQGLSGFVIPANSKTGDTIHMSGYGNVTLDGETTRTYAGASRTVVYASFSQYGTELTYYWDKETGVMVEASTISGGMTGTAKATETNMWEATTSPFWMQWWFYAIVAAGIVALVGVVYFLKKRKQPTAPSLSTEQGEPFK